MRVIEARNVNDAYRQGIQLVRSEGVLEDSRAGKVLVMQSPVATVYSRPRERVLFEPQRAANPFFHLMESIWMLAGRRDATWLDQYVSDFSSRFAEDDGNAHGAYGHRWRNHFQRTTTHQYVDRTVGIPDQRVVVPIDQLLEAGEILLKNPTSRQAVISMWDPAVDLGAVKRDVPCNDLIMLRSRRDHIDDCWELDITVLCRSNDLIWGLAGANAVHMSMVHEVLAQLSGMRTGRYTQFSNNYHAYTDVLDKVASRTLAPLSEWDTYSRGEVASQPLFYTTQTNSSRDEMAREAQGFLRDCEAFCTQQHRLPDEPQKFTLGRHQWFEQVAVPMQLTHVCLKSGDSAEAARYTGRIRATDWRLAADQFIQRRIDRAAKVEEARSR